MASNHNGGCPGKKMRRIQKKGDLNCADRDFHADRVFVRGLPGQTQSRDIWSFFEQFGEVTDVYLLRNRNTSFSKGRCFVSFKDSSVVDHLLSLCEEKPGVKYRKSKLRIFRAYCEVNETCNNSAPPRSDHSSLQSSAVGKELDESSIQSSAVVLLTDRKHTTEIGNINDKLPNIVLLQIFSHFSLAEKLDYTNVCKYWADLLKRNLSLNKEIIVTAEAASIGANERDRYILTGSGLNKALNLCPSLTVLDLTAAKFIDVKDMRFVPTVTTSCKELTVLKLPATTFTIADSVKLAKGLRRLEQLEASNCTLTDKFLIALFVASKQLRILDVSENTDITSKPFKKTPAMLQKLNINGCAMVSDTIVATMLQTCKDNLTHLSIAFDGMLLTQNCFGQLVKFRNLQYLDISEHLSWECSELLDEGENARTMFARLSELNNLCVLNLADSACIHDRDIANITRNCLVLEDLNISGDFQCITSEGFQVLKRAKSLKMLNVSYQKKVDDDCLEAFASLPQLHTLVAMRCAKISNSGLSFLALVSGSLRELDISGNKQLEGDVSVLGQFRDNSRNRAGALVIYFGGTELGEVYSELGAEEQATYSDPAAAKLDLYPDDNHSRFVDDDFHDWLDAYDSDYSDPYDFDYYEANGFDIDDLVDQQVDHFFDNLMGDHDMDENYMSDDDDNMLWLY